MRQDGRYGQLWTEEEVTLALYLYCQIPFKKTKASNPSVRKLAEHLGRTPASVARKLGNFGSFDPLLAQRSIVGLTHTGKTDLEVWSRYRDDWTSLIDDASAIWSGIGEIVEPVRGTSRKILGTHFARPTGHSQVRRMTKVRLHQSFFRLAVLTSYDSVCCVCGIEMPELLTASHIVPWSHNEELRTDPCNGLCLCALHDRAFDRGLITVSDEGRLLTSDRVKTCKSKASQSYLVSLDGTYIRQPQRFPAKPEYLEWHRANVFLKTL